MTLARPRVLVMMATYNGEKYVAEQIESVLSQEGVDVTLRISDDGSSDGTCSICEGFAERDSRVRFRRNPANKGLAKNFMDMVWEDGADGFDWYAFSDQDDVWLPEKLTRAIEALEERAPEGPALYYSDVENVGADLSGGTREYAAWASCAHSLLAVLTVNWASGCTMVFNPALRTWILSYEPSSYDRIHDGWLHLAAMVSGTVVADLGHSYIKRRISGENQVGERDLEDTESLASVSYRWKRIFRESNHVQTHVAAQLLEGFRDKMRPEDEELVRMFAAMPHSAAVRVRIAKKLAVCPFPTKSMARGYAAKALMNRL